ncbi:hypothetical protein LWI28_020595 [Acer negundo]|uniref:Retrovirus-related Pol polyprotein from transposon TNT 1-94 n=1 Tax=Acer negundo TaxID=4023 RepID=A0AAD5P5U7_ACENE|nr:hypothetical protein LWI28_020595 [Acer negundo]
MNIKFKDEVHGLWLLGTLLDSWETFRTSVSNSGPNGVVTVDSAKSGVMNEEMRRKSQGSSQSEGHIKKYCRQLKRDNKNEKEKEKKTNDSNDGDRVFAVTNDFLVANDDDVVNLACHETSWVIDSGASIHSTSRRDFFTSYTSGDFGDVKMGNNGIAKAIGMGDVCLGTNNGKLDDEGFCNTFSDGHWKLTKGSMIVARGKKCSSLYFMQANVSDCIINTMETENERSKLDVKTRQCVFIGYGQDEFSYRFYDPLQKKLVRSRDVMFMEDQTIHDIEKTDKTVSQYHDDLIDLDPVPLKHVPVQVRDKVQDD